LPHVGRHFIDGGSKRSRRSIVAILGACIELVKPFYRGPQLWKIQFGLVCKKTARCISDALGPTSGVDIGRQFRSPRQFLDDFVVETPSTSLIAISERDVDLASATTTTTAPPPVSVGAGRAGPRW
jgi:hypothetical protein